MGAGLREWYELMRWAEGEGASVQIRARRRYRLPGGAEEIIETDPSETYAW